MMQYKCVLQRVWIFILALFFCCMAGVVAGIHMRNKGKGDVPVAVVFFESTKGDCLAFNSLISKYLESRNEGMVECFAVPRRYGMALVIIDNKSVFACRENIKRDLMTFYMGYMAAENNEIPMRTTKELEELYFAP